MEFSTCPICHLAILSHKLPRHANEHFADDDCARDFEFAQEIAIMTPDQPQFTENYFKCRPTSSDNPESSSSRCDAKRTACGTSNNDEKCAPLVRLQKREIFYRVGDNLMTMLRNCLELEPGDSTSILSGYVDHFQSTESWDLGWGCGWRNIQVLSSHLLSQRKEARDVLYGGCGFVPDIGSLQQWLELAWEKGFDISGADEFDRKIYGKQNWIGTTECAALLRSFGLRARIVDFCSKNSKSGITDENVEKRNVKQVYGPMDVFLSKGKIDSSIQISSESENHKRSSVSSENAKGHHCLTEWVWNYFYGNNVSTSDYRRVILSEKAPLYFQHSGHSRTIVGIQVKRQKNGTQQYNLLVFDPSEKTRALENSLRATVGWQKLIKRGVHTLKKPQYQLCFVEPGIASGKELEELKTIHSIRKEF